MEALIIIDMQKGFFKNILGKRNNLQAEDNILRKSKVVDLSVLYNRGELNTPKRIRVV